MATRDNVHAISDQDLATHQADAEFRMQNIPMRGVAYDLHSELRKLFGNTYLLGEPVYQVLLQLRRSICLYYELYEELSATIDQRQTAFLGSYAVFGMSALMVQHLPVLQGENLASFPRPDEHFFRVGQGADDDLKALLSLFLKVVTQNSKDGQPIVESTDDQVNITS